MHPIKVFKFQIRQFLSNAYRQIMPALQTQEERDEFQTLFWKIRPLVDIDLSEFSPPGERVFDEVTPSPVTDLQVIPTSEEAT